MAFKRTSWASRAGRKAATDESFCLATPYATFG